MADESGETGNNEDTAEETPEELQQRKAMERANNMALPYTERHYSHDK